MQNRVLWLSTAIVHWANKVRPNDDGTKVGGHQASSASSVGILSSLYFEMLSSADRVAVKPHASPVLHAIQYLLGNLSEDYLPTLRALGGLQAYPSRTKDPDAVDFSTGSMGLGVAATAFAALTRDYLRSHDLEPLSGRFWAHVGDAELEEGSVWETVAEAALHDVGGLIWVVDVNRQSLDRVAPGIRIARFREMFRVNGWTVIDAKYGSAIQELFASKGGHALRRCIDDMSNEEYQTLIRTPEDSVRARLLDSPGCDDSDVARAVAEVDDAELARRLRNLGGHDMDVLAGAYSEAAKAEGPAVVFAYTIKGWGLPMAGDPLNHSAQLTQEQFDALAESLGESAADPWQRFAPDSPEGGYVGSAMERLRRERATPELPLEVSETTVPIPRTTSTQEMFGRLLLDIDRLSPQAGSRIVTMSADVATSTNLGGWINRAGVWARDSVPDVLGFDQGVLNWREGPTGRHLELGLSETNLFLALGQFGLSEKISGRRLIPIGTVYDCFVPRGLDPFLYGAYQSARFILVATPSGVTLSPEGGAHQSVITPSIGLQLPGVTYYEPCFAQELHWILAAAVRQIAAGEGESFYIRLNTKPISQAAFPAPTDPTEKEKLRRHVLDGCYRLRAADAASEDIVHIFAVGAMVPEAMEAAGHLAEEGLDANVFVVTSPDLLYRRSRESTISEIDQATHVSDPTRLLSEGEVGRPIVTVMDGHSHTLSFLGSALDSPNANLGVDGFGESGARADLYRKHRIDPESIVSAAIGVADRPRRGRA